MNSKQSRRQFIGAATSLGIGGLAGLTNLTQALADDGKPLEVKLTAAIAPLVRLLENTPREKAVVLHTDGPAVGTKEFRR